MKARPRRAENRIAEELNAWFARHNLSPIERIPVLGRKGPDYTYNELKLNLDAKSRKSIPKSHIISEPEIFYAYTMNIYRGIEPGGKYIGIRLCDLEFIPFAYPTSYVIKPSIVVDRWIEKMEPNGGIILHWPRTPFKDAVWVMKMDTYIHLREVLNAFKS